MATPRSPECDQLLKLLADHEWHFVDDVITRLIKMVAPGRAIRRYEVNATSRELKTGPRVGPELTDQEKITSGARTLAYQALTSMSKRYVETDEKGDARLCRLRDTPLPVNYNGRTVSPTRLNSGLSDAERAELLAAKRAEKEAVVHRPTPEDSEGLSCPACGAYVVNPDQHRRWHEAQDELTMQVMREAVGEEIQTQVSELRKWIQSFVINRFAALEVVLGERLPPRRWPN